MNASALLSRHRAVAGSTRSDAGGRECDLSGPCKEPPLPAASLRVDSSMSPHVPAPYAPPPPILPMESGDFEAGTTNIIPQTKQSELFLRVLLFFVGRTNCGNSPATSALQREPDFL